MTCASLLCFQQQEAALFAVMDFSIPTALTPVFGNVHLVHSLLLHRCSDLSEAAVATRLSPFVAVAIGCWQFAEIAKAMAIAADGDLQLQKSVCSEAWCHTQQATSPPRFEAA